MKDLIGCTFTTQATIPSAICGDGLITGTEECDPPGVGCCDASCQFASAIICRPASSPCDVPEYCPGNSALCPVDAFKPNDTACTLSCSEISTCQAGVCVSQKAFDCPGGYCNVPLNACNCTNTSMTYPYCKYSCPPNFYGPNCQYQCDCFQGSCIDGPRGNGTCVCNTDWYGVNCSLTNPPVFQQAKFAANGMSIDCGIISGFCINSCFQV